MTESETRQKLLNYAYFYLNIRPRTIKEVQDYLLKKAKKVSAPAEMIDSVIARLTELGMLNDREFVRWYVEGKFASARKSAFLLKRELAKLGVAKTYVDEFFAGREVDEIEPARLALAAKWKRFSVLSDEKIRFQKAATFLARRGFSYDVIKKTIAECEGER